MRVELLPDRAHAAVHHVGRRDDVGSGARVRQRRRRQPFERGIVVDVAVDHLAAVAVAGVLAIADVGHDQQIGQGAFHRAHGSLHDAVLVVILRCLVVLLVGNPEQDHAADPQRVRALAFLHQFVDRELEVAGHGGDRLADAFAGAGEQRQDEIGRLELGFAHQPPHRFRDAQPALAMGGEGHSLSIVAKLLGDRIAVTKQTQDVRWVSNGEKIYA